MTIGKPWGLDDWKEIGAKPSFLETMVKQLEDKVEMLENRIKTLEFLVKKLG